MVSAIASASTWKWLGSVGPDHRFAFGGRRDRGSAFGVAARRGRDRLERLAGLALGSGRVASRGGEARRARRSRCLLLAAS